MSGTAAGGRPPLPGFSKHVDTLRAEMGYTQRCETEKRYFKQRREWTETLKSEDLSGLQGRMQALILQEPLQHLPAQPGKAELFDIARCTRASAPTGAARAKGPIQGGRCGPGSPSSSGGSTTSLTSCASGGSSQSAKSTSRGSSRRAAPVTDLERDGIPSSSSQRPGSIRSISTAPSQWEPDFVLPKYANVGYTMRHMKEHEKPDAICKTALHLQRTLSMPANAFRIKP